MTPRAFRALVRLWPPYRAAGIRVTHVSPDWRRIEVQMRLRWFNRNWVGTHFGGSLYAMVDPFYMLMLIKNLGSAYVVWDKSACVDFVKPGRGTVRAELVLTPDRIDEVIRETERGEKYLPRWSVDVTDEAGDVVAHIDKTLYVRRKRQP